MEYMIREIAKNYEDYLNLRKRFGLTDDEEDSTMEIKNVTSCEDPHTEYACYPDIRLIFRDGVYVGWYLPE